MVDESHRTAAQSRFMEALRVHTGEAILFYVLTASIAALLGEVPAWPLFLAIPLVAGWLSMGFLERIPLKPVADPQLAAQKLDRITERITRFGRRAWILLWVELGAVVLLLVLRLSGNLAPPTRFP